MKDNNRVSNVSQEEVLETRLQNIKMDLEMIESSKERLDSDQASLILKLVSTRETLMALSEQDE